MDVGLRELVNLIWRRKLLIAAVSAGFTLLTAVVLYNIQPRYTAEALVLIDSRAVNVVHLDTAVAALPRDAEAVKSEMEIIASRGLAERVISELDLHHVEEFGGGLDAVSVADPTTRFDELDAVTRSVIINRFLAGLAVSQRGGSRVVAVEYTSVDPDRSAVIANAVADAYLVSQLEAKFEVTKRASSWLSEQISSLQDDLAESERAVERYREESGLLQAKGERLSSQQIAELNSAPAPPLPRPRPGWLRWKHS
jgi:succinoglycan biosynthesis transport protein ExoP